MGQYAPVTAATADANGCVGCPTYGACQACVAPAACPEFVVNCVAPSVSITTIPVDSNGCAQCAVTSCSMAAPPATDACAGNTCAANQQCVASPKQCITTPCPQYDCVTPLCALVDCAQATMCADGSMPTTAAGACCPSCPAPMCEPLACPQFLPDCMAPAVLTTIAGARDANNCQTECDTHVCVNCLTVLCAQVSSTCADGSMPTTPAGQCCPQCPIATADPCKPSPCAADETCTVSPKMCLTTPCPQYTCAAAAPTPSAPTPSAPSPAPVSNACSPNPCAAGETCTASPKQCLTTPCPQYTCTASSTCDATQIELKDGSCFTCPPKPQFCPLALPLCMGGSITSQSPEGCGMCATCCAAAPAACPRILLQCSSTQFLSSSKNGCAVCPYCREYCAGFAAGAKVRVGTTSTWLVCDGQGGASSSYGGLGSNSNMKMDAPTTRSSSSSGAAALVVELALALVVVALVQI